MKTRGVMDGQEILQLIREWAYGPVCLGVGGAITYFWPKLATMYWDWKGTSKKFSDDAAAKVITDATAVYQQRELVLQDIADKLRKELVNYSQRNELIQATL